MVKADRADEYLTADSYFAGDMILLTVLLTRYFFTFVLQSIGKRAGFMVNNILYLK
jgi:hypothetical protein